MRIDPDKGTEFATLLINNEGGPLVKIEQIVDVFASFLEGFEHNPVCHVFYGERMIDMRDGLPKHRGRPGPDRAVGDMAE